VEKLKEKLHGGDRMEKRLTGRYDTDLRDGKSRLRVEKNFDVVYKAMRFGGRRAALFFVDGFVKDELMEKVMQFFLSMKEEDFSDFPDAQTFSEGMVSYVEVDVAAEWEKIETAVLSGMIALLVEGYSAMILIDARTYPARGVEEPEDDRVLRGSRDGFVETLVFNTALIRRRIRDPRLTMEILQVGRQSKTDIVLCYMEGTADPKLVESLRKKIRAIRIDALAMGQESLAECLLRRQWYNPFPRVRYIERPDAAAASVLEGKIAILIDNSPSVMLLPTAIFDFTQDTNDFYFPPLVGSYLRLVRILVFLVTLLLTPTWYLLIQNPEYLPPWLEFLQVKEANSIPIIWQLLLVELVIDGLKLASLNTPSVLSNSFSVIGALILGDFAVQARWLVPEVVFYMAFVAIANFTQPSFELGYAFKLFRMLLLILTACFNLWGYLGGLLLMLMILMTTHTATGTRYLFPLFPFHGRALTALLVRRPISRKNS